MVLETMKNEFPISIGSCLFAIAIALSVPATALADANDKSQPEASASCDAIDDACYGLNQNEDWYRLFNLFSASFKAGDYDKALEYTSALEEICARSPILNYSIANTYAKIGDRERAKRYIVAATDNLNEFSTTYEMIAKIWSARCDIQSSDIKANTDDALKRENELNAQVESLKERTYEAIDAEKSHYAAIMWTGTAVGIVGIGSVVAGAVLIGTKDTDLRVKVDVNDIRVKEKTPPSLTATKSKRATPFSASASPPRSPVPSWRGSAAITTSASSTQTPTPPSRSTSHRHRSLSASLSNPLYSLHFFFDRKIF